MGSDKSTDAVPHSSARARNKERHPMRGVVMYAPGDVRIEEREDPKIIEPTDAVIRVAAAASAGRTFGPTAGSRS
jgi:hypothetical protein